MVRGPPPQGEGASRAGRPAKKAHPGARLRYRGTREESGPQDHAWPVWHDWTP